MAALASWQMAGSSAQLASEVEGATAIAQPASDSAWFVAQPKMWLEAIDADGEWWPAKVTQTHPVKGVNLHYMGKPTTLDRWVEPPACGTLLRPLPTAKPSRYTDELWDELHRVLEQQAKSKAAAANPPPQPLAAAAAAAAAEEERKESIAAAFNKSATKQRLPVPPAPSAVGEAYTATPLSSKQREGAKSQPTSPPTTTANTAAAASVASEKSEKKRAAHTTAASSSGSSTQPAPPNAHKPVKLASANTATHDYLDTFQTPGGREGGSGGKEEAGHPLSAAHSKRAIVEQLNALHTRHDAEMAQLRAELATLRLDNSRLQHSQPLRSPQPPPPQQQQGAADLLIVHTLHERYNRAVARLESEAPAACDELLGELRGLVDWHLEMTGRLNRLLRQKEGELVAAAAAGLPAYH